MAASGPCDSETGCVKCNENCHRGILSFLQVHESRISMTEPFMEMVDDMSLRSFVPRILPYWQRISVSYNPFMTLLSKSISVIYEDRKSEQWPLGYGSGRFAELMWRNVWADRTRVQKSFG